MLDPEIATPPLSGIILPGVTRKSLLELGKSWVRERGGRIRKVEVRVSEKSKLKVEAIFNFCKLVSIKMASILYNEIFLATVYNNLLHY